MIASSSLSRDDINFTKEYAGKSSLFVTEGDLKTAIEESRVVVSSTELDGILFNDWKIPNILYSPENIFANKIPALDINFINPHKYKGVEYYKNDYETDSSKNKSSITPAEKIAPTIASWYKGFRNIAIVGLLSVLVYIGIRILIGSTAPEKAKYKERLMDWIVALCLVFVIHIIMSGILMVTEKVTNMFSKESSDIIVAIAENPDNVTVGSVEKIEDSYGFRTNLTGYVRFMAQSEEFGDAAVYTILYMALIIYTIMFTFIYFKRFLYMAFFTMIAPLVALTYPLDKIRDGQAQAFNLWFKEFTMNAILQPVHLILYTVLVSSSMDLAIENPIYAIVAIAFLLPAEKFIKKMFGLDRAESTSGLGAFAGGALTMKGVGAVAGLFKGNGKKSAGEKAESNEESEKSGIKPAINSNPFNEISSGQSALLDGGGNGSVISSTVSNQDNSHQFVDAHGNPISSNRRQVVNATEQANASEKIRKAAEQKNASEEIKKDGILNKFSNIAPVKAIRNGANKISNIEQVKRLKSGAKAAGIYQTRKIKNQFSRKNIGKKVRYVGKAIPRVAGAVAGATAIGTIAAGAAITTGDMSNALAMFAGGVGTGAGLGGAVSGKVADSISKKVSESKTIKTFKDGYNYDRRATIEQKEREKSYKEFKNSDTNYQTLVNKGFSPEAASDFLKNEVQDYLNVGIDDINLIIKAEKKFKDKYDKRGRVARAQMASQLPKNYSKDMEARNKFMDYAKKAAPQLTENNISDLNRDMMDLMD